MGKPGMNSSRIQIYGELKQSARRHFEAKRYDEAQIALNVAAQYWRDMTDEERQYVQESAEGSEQQTDEGRVSGNHQAVDP